MFRKWLFKLSKKRLIIIHFYFRLPWTRYTCLEQLSFRRFWLILDKEKKVKITNDEKWQQGLLVQGYLASVPANFWPWSSDLQKDDWKIPSWKGFMFQRFRIQIFLNSLSVYLTRRPLDKRTMTQYYRTRPTKSLRDSEFRNFKLWNFETTNTFQALRSICWYSHKCR